MNSPTRLPVAATKSAFSETVKMNSDMTLLTTINKKIGIADYTLHLTLTWNLFCEKIMVSWKRRSFKLSTVNHCILNLTIITDHLINQG